ncbi:MAG TPA: hypothetical protein VIS96_11130 [Terrimicrobiaceae bacterium]
MLRKQILQEPVAIEKRGLDLASLARFEISSEDAGHPIDNALNDDSRSWRAAEDGPQTIRINFDSPQTISRIVVIFEETDHSRTQEFVLSWRPFESSEWREVVRQQFNFSPPSTAIEREEYSVSVKDAIGVELRIVPNISGNGRASLRALWIG